MTPTLRLTTRVLPGHRAEIVAPDLTEGEAVEVVVTPRPAARPRGSVWDLTRSLPPGLRSAAIWEEIERNLQEDRDAWDR